MRLTIRRRTRDVVEAFLAAKRAKGLSAQTMVSYSWWLRKFEEAHPSLPTKPAPIEAWISQWQGVTRCNAYRAFHGLYAWAVRTRHLPAGDNPFVFVEPPKRPKKLPRLFTNNEWMRIMASAKPGPERTLVLVLVDGAPRIGELVGRTKDDLTPDGLRISGKVGDRLIPLLPETVAYLREQPYHWLFPAKNKHGGYSDRPAAVNTLKNHFAAIVESAGITGRRRGPHTVRHTSAVRWLHSSGNIYALRDLLGHASVKETEIYASLLSAHQLGGLHRQHSALKQFEQVEEYEKAG